MHHCNVDRVYEKYIQLEPDSEDEMRAYQAKLHADKGENNRFLEPLFPFKKPGTDEYFNVKDTFDIQSLGYEYEDLPPDPTRTLVRDVPTYAVFYPVRVLETSFQSFELHVFVIPVVESDSWVPPESLVGDLPGYAGWGAIFGGKGDSCQNCQERGPFSVLVDISQALASQGLRRRDATLKVVCVGSEGNIVPLPDFIPKPEMRGAVFEENIDESLALGAVGDEVEALQKYLKAYKYLQGPVTGCFDDELERALRNFQSDVGIAEEGICGSETKAFIRRPRCTNSFGEGECSAANYSLGQDVKVFVGIHPGYLKTEGLLAEVRTAFDVWGKVANVTFSLVEDRSSADVVISWSDHVESNMFLFDGKGGALAHATKSTISLDEADYWILQDTEVPPRKQPFQLLPVLLHLLGLSLGLVHSKNPDDVMNPYYVPGKTELSVADVSAIAALYPPDTVV